MEYPNISGQALLTPLMLRQKGLVPAAPARRACATSTLSSSARQTFPSGLWPAVKDCFGLHGNSAFGSVAKRQIGVGRKSATSVGLTTDPFNSLQADKTVDISRCASESTDLRSAFRTASVAAAPCGYAHPPGDAGCGDFVTFAMAALPVAGRLPAAAGHRAASVDVDADGVDSDGGYTVCV